MGYVCVQKVFVFLLETPKTISFTISISCKHILAVVILRLFMHIYTIKECMGMLLVGGASCSSVSFLGYNGGNTKKLLVGILTCHVENILHMICKGGNDF
jgi:hypothetical protein